MEIVYDIELTSGEVIVGCYFIKYEHKMRAGIGSVHVRTVPAYLSCLIDDEEILNKDFERFKVLKIYDKVSGFDLTDTIFSKAYHTQIPIERKTVTLE